MALVWLLFDHKLVVKKNIVKVLGIVKCFIYEGVWVVVNV